MKKALIALGLVIALLGGGVMFISIKGEEIIRQAAETHGSAFLKTTVNVGGVYLSPLKGKATLSEFAIGQPADFGEGDSFSVDVFAINLSPMSLLENNIQIASILIDAPVLNLVLHGKDSNFEALLNNIPPAADDEEATTKRVTIKDLHLNGMKVMINSDTLGTHEATLADIHIKNIGVDENGVAPREALRITMDALKPQITKVLVKLGLKSKLGDEVEKQLGVKLPTTKDDAVDALKGLIKKKKKDN